MRRAAVPVSRSIRAPDGRVANHRAGGGEERLRGLVAAAALLFAASCASTDETSLIRWANALELCPPAAETREFYETVKRGEMLARYRTPAADAALVRLARCPGVFAWLLETEAFADLGKARQEVFVARLVEQQHAAAEFAAILDVLTLRADRYGLKLLSSAKLDDASAASKVAAAAEQIARRLGE